MDIDWDSCPNGRAIREKIAAIHEDVIEIKQDVKNQNGSIRNILVTKADKTELASLFKSIIKVRIATSNIIAVASVVITLISLGLLAYKTFH